jgi:DNA-binding GntR family transcriptional regulator
METSRMLPTGPSHSDERNVYEHLRQEILMGVLVAGATLLQEEIAARLGVSRIPVRDAIRHLINDGLVSIEANRRAVVTALQESDLIELFEIRAALESLAARHAAPNLTDADIGQLEFLARRMEESNTSNEVWLPVHREFHDILYGRCNMPRLMKEIMRLWYNVEPYVRVFIMLHGTAELDSSSHRSLMQDIKSRDPDRVEDAIREHVIQASAKIIETLQRSRASAQNTGMDGAALDGISRARVEVSSNHLNLQERPQ